MYFDPNAANKAGKGPAIGSSTIESLLSAVYALSSLMP